MLVKTRFIGNYLLGLRPAEVSNIFYWCSMSCMDCCRLHPASVKWVLVGFQIIPLAQLFIFNLLI